MTTMSCPIPHHPRDDGVEENCPELGQIEGAHLLANEAREFLRGCGFGDCEILEWAETYIAEIGSGNVDTFIAWIHERQAA
ncbi:MAG: hypothetical protein ABFR89_09365 [Actinomycetota bacterium]